MKLIKKFNELFSISYILTYVGATPNRNSCSFRYGNEILYFEYYIMLNGSNCIIQIYQEDDGTISIVFPTGFTANTAYDCYLHAVCNNNQRSALSWEKDSGLLNGNNIKPLLDINAICDSSTKQQSLRQLLFCIIYKHSRLIEFATNLNRITGIPINTIILVILGCFSAMTSKYFNVAYKDGTTVSIGMYILAELSSGNSKSRLINLLSNPMIKIIERKVKKQQSIIATLQDELADLIEFDPKNAQIKNLRADIRKHENELSEVENLLPITNGTPEAIEKTASKTNGTFSIISSEQGAVDSSCGLAYAKKAINFDMLLNGRDGGCVKSSRVGREGYSGRVFGSFLCFAQEGTAYKMLKASGVTGVFERSLVVASSSMVGYRNHSNAIEPNAQMTLEYENQCRFFEQAR